LMIDNERLRLAHHRFSFDADEGEGYTPVVPCLKPNGTELFYCENGALWRI
jgi:hypothetical protein